MNRNRFDDDARVIVYNTNDPKVLDKTGEIVGLYAKTELCDFYYVLLDGEDNAMILSELILRPK